MRRPFDGAALEAALGHRSADLGGVSLLKRLGQHVLAAVGVPDDVRTEQRHQVRIVGGDQHSGAVPVEGVRNRDPEVPCELAARRLGQVGPELIGGDGIATILDLSKESRQQNARLLSLGELGKGLCAKLGVQSPRP